MAAEEQAVSPEQETFTELTGMLQNPRSIIMPAHFEWQAPDCFGGFSYSWLNKISITETCQASERVGQETVP